MIKFGRMKLVNRRYPSHTYQNGEQEVLAKPYLVPLVATVIALVSNSDACSEDIKLDDRARGIVENLESKLRDLFPRPGLTVLGVKVYIEREVGIDNVSYNVETGIVSINAHVRYYTPSKAVINMAGLGIDVTTNFDTQFDVPSNDLKKFKVEFDLPKGWGSIDVNLGAIKQVLDGDLAAALELIPNGGLVKRDISSEYDARKKWYQDNYGKDNIYFSSSDFVRWAGLETAGNWAGGLIASGGSYATQIANEAINEARKELPHIAAWLKTRGATAAESAAQDLLSGKPISLPELKLVWQKVMYHSKVVIGGRDLPDQPVPHLAFVLVWTGPSTPTVAFDAGNQPTVSDNDSRAKWKIGARYAIGASGCRIVYMTPGGPAEKAGLSIGDVITKLNGKSVGSADATTDLLVREVKKSINQIVSVDVLSSGSARTLNMELAPVF